MRTKSKIKIGMVQISNSFSNQNYFPYSVGILQAFAQKYLKEPDNFEFLLPIYSRIQVEKVVQQLLEAHVIGFSTYVWNMRISLEIASRLKRQKPETLIVFGGPQVPDRVGDFLRKHPFIDIACHGEGEQLFLSILENYFSRNWEEIPFISYLRKDGSVVQQPRAPRISELSVIPSPYLEGVFEPLMMANPKEQWLALWETNRGCPFSCTFCDWGSAMASKVYKFDMERLFREIDWFAEREIEFVFCCDANFGILQRDLEIARYVAETKKKFGYPHALSVQNTKNVIERVYKVQEILADAGLNKGVTLSLQSVDPNTLRSVKRHNISLKSFQELQRRFTRDNIETYTDMILGLAGETYESFADGVSHVVENGQHNRIQFNNLSILPNAEMGDPEYQKKYGLIIQETKIINMHGSLTEADEIYETQQLVVGTNTIPKTDWVRVRVFSWMTALLHFDKILQIPLIILHSICSVSFKELFKIFAEGETASPIISEIRSFFINKAIDTQNGAAEYCESKEWLNIWWPADELILIKLCTENKLKTFYEEAEQEIKRFLREKSLAPPSHLLDESIYLNQNLMKLPFQNKDLDIQLSHNVWEFYQTALRGISIPLEEGTYNYHIDRKINRWSSWEDWCREVIWYLNKKGAYLYPCYPVGQQFKQ